MNRITLLKQRAAQRGLYVARALDDSRQWDVVDAVGFLGYRLTYRAAVHAAYAAALRQPRVRGYVQDAAGQWHRGTCVKVAPAFAPVKKHCRCSRLVV